MPIFKLLTPLEQFQILNLFYFYFCGFDFSLNNSTIIIFIGLVTFFILNFFNFNFNSNNVYLFPGKIQLLIEKVYRLILNLIKDNVKRKSKYWSRGIGFFPLYFILFNFILIANIIGIIPYSFTLTSHLIITFTIAFIMFFGITYIGFHTFHYNYFSIFLPAGSSLFLALLLIPIEIVSYLFRPISLSVRLFANMMAGHTLLKVIASFAWIMFISNNKIIVFSSLIPLLILIILIFLESVVAIIQAYVFVILLCIYLNDAANLH